MSGLEDEEFDPGGLAATPVPSEADSDDNSEYGAQPIASSVGTPDGVSSDSAASVQSIDSQEDADAPVNTLCCLGTVANYSLDEIVRPPARGRGRRTDIDRMLIQMDDDSPVRPVALVARGETRVLSIQKKGERGKIEI